MHGTDGGDDTLLGVHYVAYFLDVAYLLGTHLADENLIVWLKLLADGAHHAHRRIERSGSDERVEFHGQDAGQVMFGAGLAIRSGYADNLQVGHGAENALGIVDVMLTDQGIRMMSAIMTGTYEKIDSISAAIITIDCPG